MNEELKKLILEEYNLKFPKKDFVPGQSAVPVSGKVFDHLELLKMTEAVFDGWWTEGRFSDEFEKKFNEFLGVNFSSLTNSGSSANLLAFSSLTSFKLGDRRLKKGDEVIAVAAGFPTTVNPVIQMGLVPVFVDVGLGDYNAIYEEVEKAISPKTKAVFLAHTLGNPYDLGKIADLCKKNNLWFIEDCCDALGSKFQGKYVGTFGDVATCSFYPAHHITMGEGGIVFTNNPIINKIVRSIRDWGRDCWCKTGMDGTCTKRFCWQLGDLPYGYDHKYVYSELGYNLKITDIQAALGLAQLEKLEYFIEKRKENFKYLYEKLKDFEKYFILPKKHEDADPSWFGFLLSVKKDAGFTRDEFIKYLNEKKVATRLLFAGNITKQPYFINNNIEYRKIGDLPNTDFIMSNTFWIGVYPGLSQEMLDYVADCFKEFTDNL